ncbi:hypothetical protein GCM10023084_73690 [Streptomyces lacrimifluminis]|uniref:Uncharacterized protein n=1 Tax=Streptomyces lacrimifluminis TaxID=1500077 RepID=A0A917P6M4_9ACTN|nr:hypothetical protein [Streptomyces lacrimifluminis]GGJ64220.1 hypothetical protein GCM10012282_71770 [Streptomyces lacrimifluminis]
MGNGSSNSGNDGVNAGGNGAENDGAAEQWPLLPDWMWDCADCVRLYEKMRHVQAEVAALTAEDSSVDWDFTDSVLGTQIRLGRHLADAHAELLPPWDFACATCAERQEALVKAEGRPDWMPAAVMNAEEHRARHLFVPPRLLLLL